MARAKAKGKLPYQLDPSYLDPDAADPFFDFRKKKFLSDARRLLKDIGAYLEETKAGKLLEVINCTGGDLCRGEFFAVFQIGEAGNCVTVCLSGNPDFWGRKGDDIHAYARTGKFKTFENQRKGGTGYEVYDEGMNVFLDPSRNAEVLASRLVKIAEGRGFIKRSLTMTPEGLMDLSQGFGIDNTVVHPEKDYTPSPPADPAQPGLF